jgi:hypothetical protein
LLSGKALAGIVIAPAEWRRIGGADHGKANPTAFLEAAIDYDGILYICAEYYQPGLSPDQHLDFLWQEWPELFDIVDHERPQSPKTPWQQWQDFFDPYRWRFDGRQPNQARKVRVKRLRLLNPTA